MAVYSYEYSASQFNKFNIVQGGWLELNSIFNRQLVSQQHTEDLQEYTTKIITK